VSGDPGRRTWLDGNRRARYRVPWRSPFGRRPGENIPVMDRLLDLKLIRLFEFYLAAVFLISTVVRVRQYRAILQVVRAVPSRWPRLFQLVKQYRHIFLTWGTILPLVATLTLWLVHALFRRLALSGNDDLTVRRVLDLWPAAVVVFVSGLAMLAFDTYGALKVGVIEQHELEKYFDQAEYWLRSWTAPVVRFFTLGYVNPRNIVATEVQNALVSAAQILNQSLWWTVISTVLRLLFGLSLWVTYAVTRT
jgi:hypothetical protein